MKENHGVVSVIIPVYNGERFLAQAIESVLNQAYQQIEVIVVDDGSTDGTAKIAQSYQDVRYIYQNNQGNAIGKNRGIAAAEGEFIAFLDADDIWTANKLMLQVNYLIAHPHIDYTISKMRSFLESGMEWPTWFKKDQIESDVSAYLPSALLVRKSIFERIGNFNPTYRNANDSDWFFRAKDAGIGMAIIPEVLVLRRIHSSNISHQTEAMNIELMRILRSSIERKHQQKAAK